MALVIGVLLLFSIVSLCWQAYRRAPRDQRTLLLAALLAVMANILIGFLDVPLDPVEGAVFLFLLAGLALGYTKHARNRVPTSPVSFVPLSLSREKERAEVDRTSWRAAHPPIPLQLSPALPNMQKTGQSIMLQLLSWGIAVPIIFPMTALLTRYLGPVQYGEYSLTFPFLTIFALLSGTGMDPLVIRHLSRQPRSEWGTILSYASGTRLVSTIVSTGIAATVAWLLPISAEQRSLFWAGSITLLFSFSFNGWRIIYSHGFRAEQRVGVLSLLEASNRLITAGLVALVVFWHLSLFWAYVLLIYSDLPAFLVQIWLACKRFNIRLYLSLSRFREHMLGGLPLMGHNALLLLSGQMDILLLMMIVGPLSVGIFALASRAIDPLISDAIDYVNGLYPLLCTKFEAGPKLFAHLYHEATRILTLVIIPLAILVCIEARSIVALLGGPQFATAANVVQWLMWSMVATFFNQLSERACMAANLERRIPLVTITTVATNLVANLILIPRWSIIGASIASLISEMVGLCLFTLLLRKHINLQPTLRMVLSVLVNNLPALLFLLWQEYTTPLLTIPIALLLTITSYIVTRALTPKDLMTIWQLLLNRRRNLTRDMAVPSTGSLLAHDITTCPTLILPRIQV